MQKLRIILKNDQIEEIKARNIKTKLNVMNKEDHKEKKKPLCIFSKIFLLKQIIN